MAEEAEDFADKINQVAFEGWVRVMGLRLMRATRDEVIAELTVGPEHLQAYGIVHGGVYAGIIESLASVGAAVSALSEGRTVVGLENHTSFLRAVRSGTLRATAKPLDRGRRTQVWECAVAEENGRIAATGRVRLLVLEPDAPVFGGTAPPKP